MGKCRDCKRCSEMGIKTLLFLLPRIIIWLPRKIVWLFVKCCPKCKHPINWHHRRSDGSFKD